MPHFYPRATSLTFRLEVRAPLTISFTMSLEMASEDSPAFTYSRVDINIFHMKISNDRWRNNSIISLREEVKKVFEGGKDNFYDKANMCKKLKLVTF